MSDLKYFKPDIEDIRVGYECEVGLYKYEYPNGLAKATEHWFEKILNVDDVNKLMSLHDILKDVELPTVWVRVPYLTKEQIEAEGWNCTDEINRHFEKEDFRMIFYPASHRVQIAQPMTSWNVNPVIYEGDCKDINTFRYICKLLDI